MSEPSREHVDSVRALQEVALLKDAAEWHAQEAVDARTHAEQVEDALRRAESNARGKQAVIEAQRATLDRVRALADELDRERRACERRGAGGGPSSVARKNRVMRRVYERVLDDLRAILAAPQPEVDLTEQGRRLASERDDLIASGVDPATLAVPLAPQPEAGGDDE